MTHKLYADKELQYHHSYFRHHLDVVNLFASGFEWLQSTFAYDVLFAGDLNFSTRFTTNFNITGTKED